MSRSPRTASWPRTLLVVGVLTSVTSALAGASVALAQRSAGTLELVAGNAAADGAAVRIDGEPAAHVPQRTPLAAGRHLVQVGRRGYITHSQWVDIQAGQVLHLAVTLRSQAPPTDRPTTGTIMIVGDVTGARVLLDGRPRGETPVELLDVPPGRHTLVVVAPDPAVPRFEQSVVVVAGERTRVHPHMRSATQHGALRVLTEPRGATVFIDGEPAGTAPVTASRLDVGEHIIEARLEGYQPARETVTIESGRQRVIQLRMERPVEGAGSIVVRSNVRARVTVNGQDFGGTPVVLAGAEPGRYAIRVEARGYRAATHLCEITRGATCTFRAELQPETVILSIEANVMGARVHIDGAARGATPWEGEVPAGEHRVEVRAPEYVSHVEQIQLRAGEERRELQVSLVREDAPSVAEQTRRDELRRREFRSTLSHGATLTPEEQGLLDLSVGFPHILEVRISGAVWQYLDIGFGVRSFFGLTEFEAFGRTAYDLFGPIRVGAQLRLSGGLGPERNAPSGEPVRSNTLGVRLEGLLTIGFAGFGGFTFIIAVDMHSDRYRSTSDRNGSARLRVGGVLEVILSDRWNVFASFEGIAAGPRRAILSDLVGAGVIDQDRRIAARLGFTRKFGRPRALRMRGDEDVQEELGDTALSNEGDAPAESR